MNETSWFQNLINNIHQSCISCREKPAMDSSEIVEEVCLSRVQVEQGKSTTAGQMQTTCEDERLKKKVKVTDYRDDHGAEYNGLKDFGEEPLKIMKKERDEYGYN